MARLRLAAIGHRQGWDRFKMVAWYLESMADLTGSGTHRQWAQATLVERYGVEPQHRKDRNAERISRYRGTAGFVAYKGLQQRSEGARYKGFVPPNLRLD